MLALLLSTLLAASPTLEKHRQVCEKSGADACVVVHRGQVVQEWHSKRYREPMFAMSTTKSVTGLLVGMLIADGKIESIDRAVCNWIKEWCDEPRREVTLRHLLSMTAGLPKMDKSGVHTTNDKNALVIRLRPAHKPGTRWEYSNEGVQLLEPILDAAAGEPIQTYARRRLFEPLGMTSTRFHLDEKGHAWTYADLETTPRDLARVGQLILANGRWEGKQLVPEEWIRQSVAPSQTLNRNYGLLWWTHENGNLIAARGYLDTNIYIVPKADLVVVRMQSKPVSNAIDYWPAALPLLRELVTAPPPARSGTRAIWSDRFEAVRVIGGDARVVRENKRAFLRSEQGAVIEIDLPESLPERASIEVDYRTSDERQPLTIATGDACHLGALQRRLFVTCGEKSGSAAAELPPGGFTHIRFTLDGSKVSGYVNETALPPLPDAEIARTKQIRLRLPADTLVSAIRVAAY